MKISEQGSILRRFIFYLKKSLNSYKFSPLLESTSFKYIYFELCYFSVFLKIIYKLGYFIMTDNIVPFQTTNVINISGFTMDNFKTFDPNGYYILQRVGEASNGLVYFPKTSTIILDSNQQRLLINNSLDKKVIPYIAQDLGITNAEAVKTTIDYFSDKTILVQPVGIQGKVYNLIRTFQNTVPMINTSEAVATLKTTGMTGGQISTSAPLTFVGATYIGALFFNYCASVAGNNPVGTVCKATSYILSRPMKGVEITLNGIILGPLSHAIGLPLILNGTHEMFAGKGLSLEQSSKIGPAFERFSNLTLCKKVKKAYKAFRQKE